MTQDEKRIVATFMPQVECCALGMPHVHKKKDGYLFINGRGGSRFLTFRESLAYRLFNTLPRGDHRKD